MAGAIIIRRDIADHPVDDHRLQLLSSVRCTAPRRDRRAAVDAARGLASTSARHRGGRLAPHRRMKFRVLLVVTLAWLVAQLDVTLYQLTTAVRGARELLTLPRSDIEACTAAYEFFQTRQDGTTTQVGLPQGSFQRVQVAR
eukprot:COSAG06_NODE_2178_length_7407_cov_8.831554_4_plen_142_part_00